VLETFKDHEYVTFENPELRRRVKDDPLSFFQKTGKKMILDEVQKVPEILSYIQNISDDQKIKGQFILTGSESFILSEKISQTLAGRSAMLKLMPFSLKELNSQFKPNLLDYESWIHRGFYPRIYDTGLKPEEFYPFYFETYIQRDVRDLQNIRDLNQFSNFVRLCAGRTGQILDYSSLANDAGVSVNTARGWISLLEASYVIFLLQPYYKNFNKRMIKSPKLYFTDTGLVSFLLNIQSPEQIRNHYMKGNLFENLILSEVLKSRLNEAKPRNLWYYRDSNHNEVDCIIEDQSLQVIEIKSSRTFSTNFTGSLQRFVKTSGIPATECTVIYGGEENFQFKDMQVQSWRTMNLNS
jgi:predicted AAA+ superfamily ATPase